MTAGLFFSQGVVEFYLDAGELVAVLGGDVLPCGEVSVDCLFGYIERERERERES